MTAAGGDDPPASLGEPATIEFPVGRLLGAFASREPSLHPAQAALYRAQAALLNVQAQRELRALRRELADELLAAPTPLLEHLPGRFDLVVIGARGSGKTRVASRLHQALVGAGVACQFNRRAWPDWASCSGVQFVDDCGELFCEGKRESALFTALSVARARNLSTVFIAQHSMQVPPDVWRLGVFLLVTSAPWSWRILAREEMRDRLDAANEVLKRTDPDAVAFVDAWGVARAVVV